MVYLLKFNAWVWSICAVGWFGIATYTGIETAFLVAFGCGLLSVACSLLYGVYHDND